ncbi:MAG: hypothetical protein EVA44_01430 [Flavobacteriales bacterium]|nr:MAG: hypothetical protein EVA44_01430 [Flavobacteriales bacterium]
MSKKIFLSFVFNCWILNLSSQTLNVKVIDSITELPIAYSNVYFSNNTGLITDDSGNFELIKSQLSQNDSMHVSMIGYDKKSFFINNFNDSLIKLVESPIKLSDVVLTNKKLSSDEIISNVIKNIEMNYEKEFTENKIYLSRKSNSITEKFRIDKFKSTIPEINKSLIDSLLANLTKENNSGLETLAYYYKNFEDEVQKIKIIKSRETYNKEGEVLESINKKMEEAFKNELKADSYFKIKSGIFGGDLDFEGLEEIDSTNVESIKKFEEKEIKEKDDFANNQIRTINRLYNSLFFERDSYLNFILKPNKYIFSEPKIDVLGNDLVYIIEAAPKGRGKYSGTLYINPDDYAIVRIDYKNIKTVYNLKLLGIFVNIYFRDGKMIFSKYENEKYSLSYAKINFGRRIGFDRPIKLIEKNKNVKGRRKQNEISFRMDIVFDEKSTTELQVFESKKISKEKFENLKNKNEVMPEYLEEFTTNFWEEF